MPASLNQVNLIGTLTRDAEMAYTQSGTPVAKFSLAINRVWKDGNGEKREETTFVDCEAWSGLAETIEKWTAKGHTIFISGRLKLDSWEKDGVKHSRMKVVADTMQFISKPQGDREPEHREERTRRPQERREQPPRGQQRRPQERQPTNDDPDIPFGDGDDDAPPY